MQWVAVPEIAWIACDSELRKIASYGLARSVERVVPDAILPAANRAARATFEHPAPPVNGVKDVLLRAIKKGVRRFGSGLKVARPSTIVDTTSR